MQEESVQRVGEAPTSVPFVASQNTVATSVARRVHPTCSCASSFKWPLPQSGPISADQPACAGDNTERSFIQLPPPEFLAPPQQRLPSLEALFRQSKGNLDYIDLFLPDKTS
jgi:hypothetical protein